MLFAHEIKPKRHLSTLPQSHLLALQNKSLSLCGGKEGQICQLPYVSTKGHDVRIPLTRYHIAACVDGYLALLIKSHRDWAGQGGEVGLRYSVGNNLPCDPEISYFPIAYDYIHKLNTIHHTKEVSLRTPKGILAFLPSDLERTVYWTHCRELVKRSIQIRNRKWQNNKWNCEDSIWSWIFSHVFYYYLIIL